MEPKRQASREQWIEERRALLAEEKALTRAREELARKRRELPWVKITQDYEFQSERGRESLGDLFEGCGQLIVQHFMFAPEWEAGCKNCSFWSDNLNGGIVHLKARDATYVAVSQAPWSVIEPFKARMGWDFHWVSSANCEFSRDYHVWYTPEDIEAGRTFYNFQEGFHYGEHAPGFSVFAKDKAGNVYHTYSCYARGLDMLNGTYHLLDLLPKGRDEQDLPQSMAWVKLKDTYQDGASGAVA